MVGRCCLIYKMMKRLQTINESLQVQGPIKGINAGLSLQCYTNQDTGKFKVSSEFNVDNWRAQLNEVADRVTGDKLERLQKDISLILQDAEQKIRTSIDKYGFNK